MQTMNLVLIYKYLIEYKIKESSYESHRNVNLFSKTDA